MIDHIPGETRTVFAPTQTGAMIPGQLLSVEAGADEDVEWFWSHDAVHGSHVSGFQLVARARP